MKTSPNSPWRGNSKSVKVPEPVPHDEIVVGKQYCSKRGRGIALAVVAHSVLMDWTAGDQPATWISSQWLYEPPERIEWLPAVQLPCEYVDSRQSMRVRAISNRFSEAGVPW